MKRKVLATLLSFFLLVELLPVKSLAVPLGTGSGLAADDPMVVPEAGLEISGSVLEGISQDWLNANKPADGSTFYIKVEVSESITELGDGFGGFRLGTGYDLQMDFSQASKLKEINNQAFMYATALRGELDLSGTQVSVIGKSAFNGCTGLTGVILPETLKALGSDSSGSVFRGCTGLQYVRTENGDPNALFELPSGLEIIGRQCFAEAFSEDSPIDIVIPQSVTTVGNEAFDTEGIRYIVVQCTDLTNYGSDAFRSPDSYYTSRMTVLPNAQSYRSFVGRDNTYYARSITYPYIAQYIKEDGTEIAQDQNSHLYGRPLNLIFDPDTATVETDANFALPAVPSDVPWESGYAGGWIFDNRLVLKADSTVNYYSTEREKCQDTIPFVLQPIVAPPTVEPTVDGVVVSGQDSLPYYVTVLDNGTHHVGVQVTHPLENKPENPADGDIYVDFKFYWTDVSGSFLGPRSGGNGQGAVTGFSDQGFSEWKGDYNTITVDGTDHARSGDNYYMVEIEGYYYEYSAQDSSWSSGILFYKTQSSIMGGAGEKVTDGSVYRFYVDVQEDPNYQRYKIAVDKTENGTVTISPVKEEYDAGDDVTVEIRSSSGYKIKSYSVLNQATGEQVSCRKGGGDGETRQQLFFEMPAADVKITVEFAPYSYNIYVNAEETDPKVIDFGTVEEGYTVSPAAKIIYVDNIGDRDVTFTLPEVEHYITAPADAWGWSGTTATVYEGDWVGISIQPEPGLPAGDYTKTLTITTNYGTSDTITVKFSVASTPVSFTITAAAGAGGTISPSGTVTVNAGADKTFLVTPDTGYRIADVTVDGVSRGAVGMYIFENVTGNHRIEATFTKIDGGSNPGSSDDDDYILYYHSNFGSDKRFYQSGDDNQMEVRDYDDMSFLPHREGYTFACWNTEENGSGRDYAPGDIYQISGSSGHLYAQWEKEGFTSDDTGVSSWLNTKDHYAYLGGYENGYFGPDNNMTRAQAAQMFYNLLLDRDVPITVAFSDVPADAWYAAAVNTLASLGIVNGIGNNQFAPDRPITRAEFTVIAMRFTKGTMNGENIFSDVSENDWFYSQVVGSIQYGWITGYSDGTFRPNDTVTRAQATTIVNRMLGRSADESYVDRHAQDLKQFSDVTDEYWAYYQIVEATNAHNYEKYSGGEDWTELL